MSIIKEDNLIKAELFSICLIDNVDKKTILSLYPNRKNGAYYLDKFINYLKDKYQVSIKDYCIRYLKMKWPKCPVSDEDVGFKISGRGIKLSKFKRGKMNKQFCPKFVSACEKFSQDRKGQNNPMYGKTAWNKGLDRTNPIIDKIGKSREGKIASKETKQRQSQSAKERKVHGHTGIKHTKETIEKLRLNTAKLWASGVFERTTSIHIKMREFLKTLNLKEPFQEEFQVKYFSMDFALQKAKVAIECQGTYFHVDPRIYPNGPVTAMQRRNFGRDKVKKQVCEKEGWIIIPIWETEINDGSFKEILVNKLVELKIIICNF